jgi:acetyl esterase/lipase
LQGPRRTFVRRSPNGVAASGLSIVPLAFFLLSAIAQAAGSATERDRLTWAVELAEQYPLIRTDITYYTANNYESKLDVYAPNGGSKDRPTLVYFHGGGWLADYNRHSSPFIFLPILQRGWNVISVDYRPGSVSPAPAAVRDALCALRWVARNAAEFHVDLKQIVLMGHSAGGLLALTAGMIPLTGGGLGGPCVYADGYGPPPQSAATPAPPIHPAAIVSWSGPTDIEAVARGAHSQPYATMWLGTTSETETEAVAKVISPLTYVRADLPPIVTVHGDQDPLVPYDQDVRLHAALTRKGVSNRLVTIPGGGHSMWGVGATRDAWLGVFAFLRHAGLDVGPE